MTITYHDKIEQGSDSWLDLRCGVLTASDVGQLVTVKTLKLANNDKSRALIWEKTAQRITGEIEPQYISDDMLRGIEQEPVAAEYYSQREPFVREIGFVTREFEWGLLGCSPDRLVGDDGGWECKCPRQKRHVQTVLSGEVPDEHIIQVQTCLLVTGRDWWDFSSFFSGLPMPIIRVYPDEQIHAAIMEAHRFFEESVATNVAAWSDVTHEMIPTEKIEMETEVYVG